MATKKTRSKPTKSTTRKKTVKAPAPERKGPYAKADKLIEKIKDRSSATKAVTLLEQMLDADPENPELYWRIAKSWIRVLEKETGTVLEEDEEHYPLLDEYGKLALEAAETAYDLDPENIDCIGWHLVAYGYYSVAIGVVRAVLQGAATRYLRLADELNESDPGWLSAAGYRAMGRFYREAPWPKKNLRKSIQCFRKAIALAPKRLENHLHLGLALADNGDEEEARECLHRVTRGKLDPDEAHFGKALQAYAKQRMRDL